MAGKAWHEFMAVCGGISGTEVRLFAAVKFAGWLTRTRPAATCLASRLLPLLTLRLLWQADTSTRTSNDPATWCHTRPVEAHRPNRLANNLDRWAQVQSQADRPRVDFTKSPHDDLPDLQQTDEGDFPSSWIPEYSVDDKTPEDRSRQSPQLRQAELERRKIAIFKQPGPPVPTPSTRSATSERIDPSPDAGMGTSVQDLRSMALDAFGAREAESRESSVPRGTLCSVRCTRAPSALPGGDRVAVWQKRSGGALHRRTSKRAPRRRSRRSTDSCLLPLKSTALSHPRRPHPRSSTAASGAPPRPHRPQRSRCRPRRKR